MSNTPTSAAQVAEGMNLEAEREAFEAWHRSKFETKHSTGQPTRDMHNGIYAENYGPKDQQLMWEVWQAARTAAPVAEGVALPPLPPIDEHWMTNDHTYTAEQVRQAQRDAIAPYAERIRLLERELELSKKKLGLALKCDREKAERLQDIAEERAAPAWAAFADNGNVIIWSRNRSEVDAVAVKYGRPVEPILAYIDARTAGPAEGWQPIEIAPKDREIWAFNGEQARMKWSEGDCWALWVWADELLQDADPSPDQPTHWMPLAAAPKPQEDA